MTEENIGFVKWYRKYFSRDKDLPCLKCEDEKIVRCANAPYSCLSFHNYVYQRERKISLDKVS